MKYQTASLLEPDENLPIRRGRLSVPPLQSAVGNSDSSVASAGGAELFLGDALDYYPAWPAPIAIVSDGPYGLSLFPGDPATPDELPEWYAPHVAAWSRHALPSTTLWFWGTEIGWALIHPVLARHGWTYRTLHVWDKGVGHIAGNVNSKTIRGFPVATEVCAQYVVDVKVTTANGERLPLRQWLRREWQRTGLPLDRTNVACGVRNAATRKYFTQDHMWYFPPPEMMERLANYADQHGDPAGKPYFSLDGGNPLTAERWTTMRAKWHHVHGVTNVWSEPAVRGAERLKDAHARAAHANQKPVSLIERIIQASTDPGDVVWEPFGGLCSAGVAAMWTQRRAYCAESNPAYFAAARARIGREASLLDRYRQDSGRTGT
jgi:hypothetical protein